MEISDGNLLLVVNAIILACYFTTALEKDMLNNASIHDFQIYEILYVP